MTVEYTKGMEAKLPGGAKMVQYKVGTEGTEVGLTIAANLIGLSTIMWADAKARQVNAAKVVEYTVGIGTFTPGKGDGNYATVRAYNVAASGAFGTKLLGTFEIMAIGL